MIHDTPDLPSFERPPVVETVFAVRFRELPAFTSARIGQFWERYLVAEFPATEDRPPYNSPVERLGTPSGIVELQLRLSQTPPPSRQWFIGGNNILQLQPDWFAYNWRQTDEQPEYIRYKEGLNRFRRYFGSLDEFARREFDKPLAPVQCEITYVNVIRLTGDDLQIGPFGDVLRVAKPARGQFLPVPEDAEVSWTYSIAGAGGELLGRLHVKADQIRPAGHDDVALRLVLTARGRPLGESEDGLLKFFDLGHEWIVRGFKDVTTEQMWDRWGLEGKERAQ